jgi:WD40 repeat protein
MIRKAAIKTLGAKKIVPLLEKQLVAKGFKYLKTKSHFYRVRKDFKEMISYNLPYSAITFNEETEEIFLNFFINFIIKSPKYDKWHLKTFEKRGRFCFHVNQINTRIELSFDDFTSDSFFEPTASQKFKSYVRSSIIAFTKEEKDIIPIDEVVDKHLLQNISKFEYYHNVENVSKDSKYRLKHMYLLYFFGLKDLANKQFEEYYSLLINEIEDKSKKDRTRNVDYLMSFIEELKILGIDYKNPYKKSIKLIENKKEAFVFSPKTKFEEVLRFDISEYTLDLVLINSSGGVLILVDGNKILKLNNQGEFIFEKELETQEGYEKRGNTYRKISKYIEEIDCCVFNNYLIYEDEIIALELPTSTDMIKKGYKEDPNFHDLVYSSQLDKFFAMFQNQFIRYSRNGKIENVVEVGKYRFGKIILEKEWIITPIGTMLLADFEGKEINTYKFGGGNSSFSISNDNQYLLCYGYSTKSQLYNLINQKKHTLWAHPTYIKNYKEIMYNDTEHNFDLTIAKFSPNDEYIVGGGYHGKYVAWKLPDFERIELIPQQEMINNLVIAIRTELVDGVSTRIGTPPELVELKNQVFLKNRGNNVRNIEFYENGDIFTTELNSGYILTWNRSFENISFTKTGGALRNHDGKYLTKRNAKELVVYKRN